MKASLFVLFAGAAFFTNTLQAQDRTRCPDGAFTSPGIPNSTKATQDACQKAIDLFQYLVPQLGTAIAGGNATLGQGGTLGGLGHFLVDVRINAVQGSIPQVDRVSPQVQGVQKDNYDTKTQIIPMPTADLAIGVFKGLPLAITNVGGIDLLVSASYLPEFNSSGVSVKVPNGSLKLGYGVRLGVLQESLLVPGISVTYLRRDLPTVGVAANNASDTLNVNDLSLRTKAWRVVASKSLLMFGVAVGAGQDHYESSADIRASVAARPPFTPSRFTAAPTSPISQDVTRTNVFADLSLNLLLFKLTGEIGQVSGGTINTYNTFSGKQAADSRIYGSVGARFGF